jgi:hypothetical protein
LAPLVKKVGEDKVVEMTNKLCDKLINGKEQHRDTASIALKTIIAEVTTPSLAEKILISIAPQLIKGVNTVSFLLCFPRTKIVHFRPLFSQTYSICSLCASKALISDLSNYELYVMFIHLSCILAMEMNYVDCSI